LGDSDFWLPVLVVALVDSISQMRYRLRTLLILLAVMPPMLAVTSWAVPEAVQRYRRWCDPFAGLCRSVIPIASPLDFPEMTEPVEKLEPQEP
jgi:hypothetical protein